MRDKKHEGFAEAIARLKQAQQNFDRAEPEFIRAATLELMAAEEYVSAVFRTAKGGRSENTENGIKSL